LTGLASNSGNPRQSAGDCLIFQSLWNDWAITTDGFTTINLIEAIHAGSLSAVIKALAEGNDLEMPDMHGYGGLPLRTACFAGNPLIVRELLNRGANPNAIASDGPGAPLRLALRTGHQAIVDQLLQAGAVLPPGINVLCQGTSAKATQPSLSGDKPDSKPIESTSPSAPCPGNDPDAAGQFGAETRLLSMDLLFLDENETPIAPPPASEKR
jgi:hypothetical protein